MPIYEYSCLDCESEVEILFRSFADLETKAPICPQCQGQHLERLISSVAVRQGRGREAKDQATTASMGKTGPEDSTTLAQTMRQASRRSGQDMGGDFKEVAGRLERGESATSIEKSLRKRVGEDGQVH